MTAVLSEAQLHRACAQYLAAVLPPEVIWTTIGHGGGGKVRGAQLKAMGMRKGVPDILICWHDTAYLDLSRIGWIELKSEKGRIRPEQHEFLNRASDLGHYTDVVRSRGELEELLSLWRVPTRISADVELVKR